MSTIASPISTSGMHAADYHGAAGLSASGMKDLEVSPLRYWYLHINPNRPKDEPTPAMKVGTALHYAVLEPSKLNDHVACQLKLEPHWLVTVADIRTWLTDHGVTPKGARKDGLITQALARHPEVKIWDVEEKLFQAKHDGKTILHVDDWTRVHGMANALRNEPRLMEILSSGQSEVSMFATDPDTGVLLKSRMDWVTPRVTLDLKTFSQQRGKTIDRCVNDAIFYEKYYRQAHFYHRVRLQQENPGRPDSVLAFVESEEPFEVRLKVLRPTTAGQPNLYWMRAATETNALIERYRYCTEKFGSEPWRDQQEIDPLVDEEIPQLAWN